MERCVENGEHGGYISKGKEERRYREIQYMASH